MLSSLFGNTQQEIGEMYCIAAPQMIAHLFATDSFFAEEKRMAESAMRKTTFNN